MADSNITRNAMAAAMKALMKEKKLSKISISDICGACIATVFIIISKTSTI